MATDVPAQAKKTCFVVMGFGKKTDFETGRTLDLDKSYKNLIKPAVEEAGLECIRADEIVHSGLIDVPMYEKLLKADVVVADLSTSNKNAFYELGVRHALRPYTTVVVAEDGIKAFPFDVNHVVVRQYHHLGEDIGFSEVMRFREELTKSIRTILEQDPNPDSPVYWFLKDLTPPQLAAAMAATAKALGSEPDRGEDAKAADLDKGTTYSVLMQQVDEAQRREDFVTARSLLSVVRKTMKDAIEKEMKGEIEEESPDKPVRPEDPYIIQRLALLTYKSKSPTERAALEEASDLLKTLGPDTSNDTETLGLWGAVHKRLWEILRRDDPRAASSCLDEAIRAYERGFFLRNDYYNGINFAYLLNVRAATTDAPADAIADFVQAGRIRKEVLAICDRWIADNPPPDDKAGPEAVEEYFNSTYWVLATKAEALIGLGDPAGEEQLRQAAMVAPASWMGKSTEDQLRTLRPLIADSPLEKYLKVGGGATPA